MNIRLELQLKELDEILQAVEANTTDSTMRLARSGRDIIADIIEEQELNKVLEVG